MTDYGTLYIVVKNLDEFTGFGNIILKECTRGVVFNGAAT